MPRILAHRGLLKWLVHQATSSQKCFPSVSTVAKYVVQSNEEFRSNQGRVIKDWSVHYHSVIHCIFVEILAHRWLTIDVLATVVLETLAVLAYTQFNI